MPHFQYQRQVPFPAGPVFDLVADVERYPRFLPGWREARIVERGDNSLTVEQTLGGWGFRWRFRSRAALDRPRQICIQTTEYPFEHLLEIWRFRPMDHGGTLVTLEADYRLADLPLRGLVSAVFDRGFRQTLDGFDARAHAIFD